MKGRSQRMPQAEPPDDWGDGSWTVDCSCGVTFDDGEEMVSCDECGVWVHTRCSRYVRGEASFACHNCKAAARRLRSAGHMTFPDDTEETEVAQLLVELPTKTDVCPPLPPPPPLPPGSAAGTQRRRLWGEIPLEDRVHVQGVPGGDPSLFEGLSSVFTSQLWKCTGYVPKKFNFQYKELPCWEDEEKKKLGMGKKDGEEDGDNPANRGAADMLFALSKQIIPYVPVKKFDAAMKHEDEGKIPSGSRSLSCRKKDRSKLRTFGQANIGRKKARSIADKIVGDNKRRGSVPSIATKKIEFQKDKNLRVDEATVPGPKSEAQKDEILSEGHSNGLLKGMGHNDKPKHLTSENNKGMSSEQRMKEGNAMGTQVKIEKLDQQEALKTETSKIDLASRGGKSSIAKDLSIDEVSSRAMYYLKQPKDESNFEGHSAKASSNVVMDSGTSKLAIADTASGCKEALGEPVLSSSNDAVTSSTKVGMNGLKIEGADDLSIGNLNFSSSRGIAGKLHSIDNKQPGQLLNKLSENIQDRGNKSSFPSHGHKSEDVKSECNELKEGISSRTGESKKHNRLEDSSDCKAPLEIGHGLKSLVESTKSKSQDLNKLVPSEPNIAVSVIKDSTLIPPAASKLSVLGLSTSTSMSTSSSGKASHLTKAARAKVNISTAPKKESAANPALENMEVVSENPAKGQSKVSTFPGSKSSQMSRTYSATELMGSDSKQELPFQSSKASAKVDTAAILCSDDVVGSWQSQVASGQTKPISPNPSQRTEKSHQPSLYTTSKVSNTSILMHPSVSCNTATNLSDEELALLLHQELNSSPRVPRVPRMRQAAGVQLNATSGMSVLSKRPVSGGKDQVSVFRRKNKEDTLRDVSRNSHELSDESRRKGRIPSFSDHKRQQISTTADKKKESQSRPPDLTSTKSVSLAPSEGEKSDPFSSSEISEQNTSVACSSPGDVPRDESSVIARTLPGLIDGIMSKHKHITYEELCNAVHPHWHDLRKPNGERYAYPSHLHAVHDCLRNRSEWAHLIDQGPKTNSSKKRRKVELDSDMPTVESESEKARTRASKEEDNGVESHREDVPKGKRKARKRRRLQLRGAGVEEDRKRQSCGAVSDYYHSAFSHSSNEGNESLFSEDESQGVGLHAVGTETSSSSSDDSS
ncbi:hypothetical protein Cni_G25568 [Canna indica]|uniref:Zinc finger PHD-type domain-containing protein n=1 Tax=Canna indica TaxID=4628 RepID=A0AAQ3KY55_9LILI|nr:hypothetical protein Cni_G25568 [Canna indica]